MDKQQLEKLKAFADFSITPFYQEVFKPYLEELVNKQYNLLDAEPLKEFDCLKRDISLYSMKTIIRQIIDKIDKASSRTDIEFEKLNILKSNMKKYEN